MTAQEYKFVSLLIWGCVIKDRTWAEETSIFKEKANQFLTLYPQLDKSFWESNVLISS